MKRGAKRFKKQVKGKGERIKRRDRVNKPDLIIDFAVIDCVIELTIIRQRV